MRILKQPLFAATIDSHISQNNRMASFAEAVEKSMGYRKRYREDDPDMGVTGVDDHSVLAAILVAWVAWGILSARQAQELAAAAVLWS